MIAIGGTTITKAYLGSTELSNIAIGDELLLSSEPEVVIMTDVTNPAVMAICYAQGWAANADYMTKKEAEAVTDISTVFSSAQISAFDEFKFFTGVSSIAANAFKSCTMTSITMPSSIRTIGKDAFRLCTGLTQIIVPEGVTTCATQWVYGCGNVTLLDLPTTVTTLAGYGIQTYSTNQVNYIVICRAVTPPTLGNSGYLSKLTAVYVPDDSVDAYKAKAKWTDFSGKIYPLSDYNN